MENLSEKIVKELQARNATPKPRWQFLLARGVFWTLAASSVLIGSIAFSVASFVFFDNDGMSVAVMERSSIYDIAQSIPFIWLIILAAFTACAYFGFRQTARGYRYATLQVVVVAVGASIALGLAFNTIDLGQRMHEYLLAHTSFYDPLIHSRDDEAD